MELLQTMEWSMPTPEEREREKQRNLRLNFDNWLKLRQDQWRRRWMAKRREEVVALCSPPPLDIKQVYRDRLPFICKLFTSHVMCRAFELMRLNDDYRSGRPFGRMPIRVSAGDLHDPFAPSLWEDYHLRHPELHARMQNKNTSRLAAARLHETWEEAALAEMLERPAHQAYKKHVGWFVANYEKNKAELGVMHEPSCGLNSCPAPRWPPQFARVN